MKKLNITKERFEKSRYFQKKYGTLEYVSESGKLFKTNKGKVLKFNEANGIRRSGKKTLVGFSDDNWLGIPGVVDSDDVIIYRGNEVPKGDLYEYLADDFPEFADLEGDEEEAWLLAHKKEVKEMIRDMAWAYDESTKKFGKKFTKENVEAPDEDLTCPNCSGNDIYVDAGYATCGDCDYSWELKDYTSDKYSKEYDESKKFGKKFKESVGDVSNDPAYICPYCGRNDCEFDEANEIGESEGYFDGATFNTQFWCNQCEMPYNVTFELKVKEVTPNEDYHNNFDD